MEMVRQCLLIDKQGGRTIAWIDARVAEPGIWLTIKNDDGTQTPTVKVDRMWGTRPAAEMQERRHDYTRTRRASDI